MQKRHSIRDTTKSFDWQEDSTFERYRLAGPHSMIIEKCTPKTRAKLTALDEDLAYAEMRTVVDAAIARGELYVIDLEALDGLLNSKV